VKEAADQGAKEIVLTGGEPTLRKDLAAIIAYAKTLGLATVLETNATLVDAPRALEWKQAGLDRVRVNLAGGDERLDAVTRDEGGFQRTLAGLHAFRTAGIPIEVMAAVIRSTVPLLPSLPKTLAREFGEGIDGIVLAIPVESPDPTEILDYAAVVDAIIATDTAAREVGLLVRLGSDTGLPPCVFPSRAASAHLLYAMSPGAAKRRGFHQVEACGSCQVADRCAGLSEAYLARFPLPVMKPIRDDKTRRRLSVMSTVQEQITRELVSPNRREKPGMPTEEERIIRVNFQCNQACRFCFVSTHLPAAHDSAIRQAIVEAGKSGARITLSGGEPTLNARLVDYVRLARESSTGPVELQTNAIRLADAELARNVITAGVDEVFVSLHGSTAEISDAITDAPGTFVKTVAGLDNLVKLEVALGINFVICQSNYRDLPAFIRLVHARWPKSLISLSFVAPSSDLVPHDRELIPRHSEVVPFIREAMALAWELGLVIAPLESMCGLPLCHWPTEFHEQSWKDDLPASFDAGEFIKPPACNDCVVSRRCFGIRRRYASLYGVDEIRPILSLPVVSGAVA
jgi:MoaA/NifB/PqqE/SkfB family radical SAM enzyme